MGAGLIGFVPFFFAIRNDDNRMVSRALIFGWKASGMIRPTGFRIETAD